MSNIEAAKRKYSSIALLIIGFLVIIRIINYFVSLISLNVFKTVLSFELHWLLVYLPGYLLLIFAFSKIKKREVEKHKLELTEFIKFLIISFPIVYAGNIIGNVFSEIISSFSSNNPLLDLVVELQLSRIIIIVLIGPFFEELIYRKLILDRIVSYGEKPAIIFSALIFALVHINLYQFFYAFGLGLLLAYIYIRTGKLRYSLLIHVAININGGVIAPMLLNLNEYPSDVASILDLKIILPILITTFYSYLTLAVTIIGIILIVKTSKELLFKNTEFEIERKDYKTLFGNWKVISMVILTSLLTLVNLFIY